jgi:hypothetical protein
MSENTEPGLHQPPPGGGRNWRTPPPSPAGAWGTGTPSDVPGRTFTPGGVGGGWSAQGNQWGAAPPGWGMPPPAPPRRTARLHVVWLVVALVAALGSGTAGFLIGKSSEQISSNIRSGAAATGARPCHGATTPGPAVGSHLASRLLPLPRGAKYLKGLKHRVDTLDDYVKTLYSSAPYERARLVARCFQVAAQQGWVLPSGRIVAVYLAQFGTHADARSYALAAQSADLADKRNKLHGPVTGVSDRMIIEAPAPDKYGNTVTRLIADKGKVAIIVHLFVPAHLPQRAVAERTLRHQAARL